MLALLSLGVLGVEGIASCSHASESFFSPVSLPISDWTSAWKDRRSSGVFLRNVRRHCVHLSCHEPRYMLDESLWHRLSACLLDISDTLVKKGNFRVVWKRFGFVVAWFRWILAHAAISKQDGFVIGIKYIK